MRWRGVSLSTAPSNLKYIAILATILLGHAGNVQETLAHQTPPAKLITAFKFEDGQLPVIDGDLSEWHLPRGVPEHSSVFTGGHLWFIRDSTFDDFLDGIIIGEFGWSDATNSLYLAARGGPNPGPRPDLPWSRSHNSLLGIVIDSDHSGRVVRDDRAEEGILAQNYDFSLWTTNNTGSSQSWIFSPWVLGSGVLLSGMPGAWPTRPPHTEWAIQHVSDHTFQLEASFKVWEDLDSRGSELSTESTLYPGQVLGLNIILHWIYTFKENGIGQSRLMTLSFPTDSLYDGASFSHLALEPVNRNTAINLKSLGAIKLEFQDRQHSLPSIKFLAPLR